MATISTETHLREILIPERPGNRLADTLTNLLADPRIALLFLIPGIGDTFRVNGRAAVVDDPELLAPSAVEGRVPKLGVLVTVEEAFTHCPKALIDGRAPSATPTARSSRRRRDHPGGGRRGPRRRDYERERTRDMPVARALLSEGWPG